MDTLLDQAKINPRSMYPLIGSVFSLFWVDCTNMKLLYGPIWCINGVCFIWLVSAICLIEFSYDFLDLNWLIYFGNHSLCQKRIVILPVSDRPYFH